MNQQFNVNPNQVRISDVGRIITSIPRALFSKVKEKWAQMKTRKQELKAERQSRKEGLKRHREYKKNNSKIRKFFAGILNRNPKAKKKIQEREAKRQQQNPASASATPTPTPTPAGASSAPTQLLYNPLNQPINLFADDSQVQNVFMVDENGQAIGIAGVRIARIPGDKYRIIIDRTHGKETYEFDARRGPTL